MSVNLLCNFMKGGFVSIVLLACSASQGGPPGGGAPIDPLKANGLTVTDQVAFEGDTGYLAEDGNGKPALVLQGSPHSMGYQMGYLLPEGAFLMTTEFTIKIIEGLIGISPDDLPVVYDFVLHEARILFDQAIQNGVIPDDMLEEMQGTIDGAAAQGFEISWDDILMLNMGFDSFYSFLFTGILPSMNKLENMLRELSKDVPDLKDYICIQGSKVRFPKANPHIIGCNEFVVSGSATTDARVFHGRDFMFSTGGVYQDVCCMAVYLPDSGYPFSAVTAPGLVGPPTALNSQGLSIGVDVIMAGCTRSDPGLASPLVVRDIIQNCRDLDESIERMKQQDRGVSWLYVLADDERSALYTHGVVVEEGMSDPDFTGPDLLPPSGQRLLSDSIQRLDDEPLPERGLMMRSQEWLLPQAFEGEESFPDPQETWPDVVLVTNHYIIPRMVFTTFTPWMTLVEGYYRILPGSLWRYELLLDLIATEYGDIDFDAARNLIDYLNPNSTYGDTGYYEPGGPVRGHHAIIDNKGLVLEGLFGYYGPDPEHRTPWARIDMKPFIESLNIAPVGSNNADRW